MRVDLPKFNEVEAGFEPIPAGRYTVLVSNARIQPTKAGDSKIVVWELTVMSRESTGRKLFLNNSLKAEALWNLKAFLKGCDAKYDDGGFSTEDVVGRKLDVNVEQEEYEGRVRNRISPPYYPASVV